MIIETCPRKIFKIHVAIIFLLLCANSLGIVSKLYFDHDYVYGLVPLFDFDTENNIPTLFSTIMIIICSVLLYFIAMNYKITKSSYIPWLGLSLIFLFLALDEINSIHERLSIPTREAFETSGFLYFAWVIPYGVALIVFITIYGKFLFNLPKNIRLLFLVSGFMFVSGAIGFEMIAAKHAESNGTNNFLFSFLYTCEELLEMLGIAIFLYTLLIQALTQSKSLTITVVSNKTE